MSHIHKHTHTHMYIYIYHTYRHTYVYIWLHICKYIYIYSAQLKTCCRIGGWNHHSGHRGNNFLRQLHTKDRVFDAWSAGRANARATDSLLGAHASGVNFRTYNLLPPLLRAGFGGRWLICETGLATQLFFSSFCPIIWGSIFGQHGRSCNDSLRARPASPPKGLFAQSVLAQS